MRGAAVARSSAVAVRRFSTGDWASGRTDSSAAIDLERAAAARSVSVVSLREINAARRCWNLGVIERSAISTAVKRAPTAWRSKAESKSVWSRSAARASGGSVVREAGAAGMPAGDAGMEGTGMVGGRVCIAPLYLPLLEGQRSQARAQMR
jgi:hypothetical protein